EAADPLERVDPDLAPVDADLSGSPDLVGDVGRRHGAEQRARGACLHLEAEHRLAQHLCDLLRLLGAACLVLRTRGVHALELGDPGRRGVLGELPGKQVVPRVAAGDVDDVPPQAELLHVLEENDLHQPTYGSRAISRARFTAAATWIWCRRQAPVIRRERIFPFSEMYRRSCARFL